jgi:hypothetical protein
MQNLSHSRSGLVVTSALVLGLALTACGRGGKADPSKAGTANLTSASSPNGGSCNQDKAGTCSELADDVLGLAESACKDLVKGSYAKAPCPRANLMGVCERKNEKKYYYFGGALPWVSDAKESCEKDGLEPGKFTAQPNAEQTAKDQALPPATRIAASCMSGAGTCEDLYGESPDLQKTLCEQFDGKFSTSACPSDKLVASCVKNGKVERLYEASLHGKKLADLQTTCEKYALPFGHFYPNASYKPATPPAKKKKAKRAPTE